MGGLNIFEMAHVLSLVFSGWWLLVTWFMGVWSLVVINPALQQRGLIREAELAFFGGWFWIGCGLLTFALSYIFVRYF
ncbi:MAG TPA: hypothetical protein GXX34_04925 [Clostridia bacterium]|nr:hypothetical protein [Clostridia bacterium]